MSTLKIISPNTNQLDTKEKIYVDDKDNGGGKDGDDDDFADFTFLSSGIGSQPYNVAARYGERAWQWQWQCEAMKCRAIGMGKLVHRIGFMTIVILCNKTNFNVMQIQWH